MAPTTASPLTWTLRFKHHKSTTLLHIDPLQSLDSIKAELIRALRETHPSGSLPSGKPVPSDPATVILARPRDIHNPEKGWTRLVDGEGAALLDDAPSEKRRKGGASDTAIKDENAKAVGLRDGGVVAWKIVTEDAKDEEELEEEEWDVILPSYEDAGGVAGEG